MAATSMVHQTGPRIYTITLLNRDDNETAAAVQKVDISGLTDQHGNAPTHCKIMRAWYNIGGNAIDVFFDATTDQHAWTFHQGNSGYNDHRCAGGLKPSNTGAAGFTGDIMLQMRGTYAAATSGYAITLELELVY